jgi:hypothetical protein
MKRYGFAFLAAGVVACDNSAQNLASADAPAVQHAAKQIDHTHTLRVEWAALDNFQAVVENAHLIVHGRVVAQRTVPGRVAKAPPRTVSTVAVEAVARSAGQGVSSMEGGDVTPGSTIEIDQIGGLLQDGCVIEPSESPVLRGGEEGIFLLSSDQIRGAPGRAGAYHVLGGFQGRLAVRQGIVGPVVPGSTTGQQFHGRTVEGVLADMKGP